MSHQRIELDEGTALVPLGTAVCDLDTTIRKLCWLFNGIIPDDDITAMRDAVLSPSSETLPELPARLAARLQPSEPLSPACRRHIAEAWISYVLADEARARGDVGAAWHHASTARYHEGRFMVAFAADTATAHVDGRKEAGRAGGRKSGVMRSALIPDCVRLLQSRRPPEGWPSHEAAFESIASDLAACSEAREELWQKVSTWLKQDERVRAAYVGSGP